MNYNDVNINIWLLSHKNTTTKRPWLSYPINIMSVYINIKCFTCWTFKVWCFKHSCHIFWLIYSWLIQKQFQILICFKSFHSSCHVNPNLTFKEAAGGDQRHFRRRFFPHSLVCEGELLCCADKYTAQPQSITSIHTPQNGWICPFRETFNSCYSTMKS